MEIVSQRVFDFIKGCMVDFLARLFDPSGFPARWQCGSGWTDTLWLGWLHILSDLGVWSAYLAIPLVLGYFLLRRKDLPFRKIFLLFGAFILACGTTHLMEAIIFWWPAYRLAGVIKLFTAVVSWATVFALFRVVPRVLTMRTPEELEREIAARTLAEGELQRINIELEQRVQARTADLTQAVVALRNERELLQTTLASIGDGMIVTDLEGRVTFLNGVAETLTGWTTADAQGVPLVQVFQIVNEKTRQPVENPAMRALQQGIIMGLANHTILRAKDGAERPIDDSAAPIRSEDGTIRGAVLVFHDVTEHRRSVMKLSEQEERLRLAVEATGLGIFDYLPRTEQPILSARCKEIWGFPPDAEVSPGVVFNTIHPDDREIAKQVAKGSLDPHGSGEFVMEHRIRRPDGSVRWLLVRGKTMFDDSNGERQAIRSLGTMLDITDRRLIEESLRQSELREKERVAELETVLRATPTPIWISHDRECHHVTGNPASYRLLQLPEDRNVSATPLEMIDRKFREYRNGVPVPSHELPLQISASQGVEIEDAELSLVFDDGHVRHIYGNTTPLRNQDGLPRGAVGAFVDITELKKVEQELKEANRLKDEFLATLAHELRNPLAPIRNSLEVMKRASDNTGLVEQSRSTIERQISQMVRLVDDLLDVSRISRGKIELRLERVELQSIIHQAIETIRPAIQSAGHELIVMLPDQPVFLRADAVRLAQVFSNLLNNSCKYSEPSGRITLNMERLGNDVLVSVKDAGIGIPPDMLTHIFGMFTQVDQALERSQGGLGIGLTLVERLVEMHGGSVSAFSEGLGRGSEFVVQLPLLTEDAPPPETTINAPPPKMGHRILVVDDNRDSATTMAMLLRITGNETRTAFDGLEAVEVAATFKPDLVLLDLGLPKLNGYDTARKIREQPWGEQMVLVALTGWGQEEDRRKSAEAGFNVHLVKPVDHPTLTKLLAELLPKPI